MTTALEHLTDKISRAVRLLETGSQQKFNKGAMFLAASGIWRQNLSRWIDSSLDDVLARHQVTSRRGQSMKLTQITIAIGQSIAFEIGLDDNDPFVTIPIGDLILEALMIEGIISIGRETNARTSPYVIKLEKPVYKKAILRGTLQHKPKDITTLRNVFGKPFIKGWTDERAELFNNVVGRNPVFVTALNKLRQTQWKLNKEVLDTLRTNRDMFVTDSIELVHSGSMKRINFPVNENANDLKGVYHWAEDKSKFLKEKDARLQKIRSKNYEYEIIMLKAQEMPETFYQEYTCDYRGRIYCTESFLQFQGTDIARGLFLFGERKEYTEAGLFRLKVHIANCYNISLSVGELPPYFTTDYKTLLEQEGLEEISLDKLTLEDRVAYVDANYDQWSTEDLDSTAESPVSFLAAVKELYYVILNDERAGHLPIPVDGSNNGWQHLSAMSKDRRAADLVSCTDVPVQRDFYVAVAKEIRAKLPEWFAKRDIPMKHVRKGIAKRGAMTRAYSAGAARIAENMFDDCHMFGFLEKYKITQADCTKLSKTLIEAVNTVCAGPLRVTKWLQQIAESEMNAGELSLNWVTPSGFPVYYEMYQKESKKVWSSIEGIGQIAHVIKVDATVKRKLEDGTWEITTDKIPDRRSYASGIAPNVVHSFDAAHMAHVIANFDGCFGAVHDSFSTHASDVDQLLSITKEKFIELYSTDNWFKEFLPMICRHKFSQPNPELGDYDVNEVRQATYFFC